MFQPFLRQEVQNEEKLAVLFLHICYDWVMSPMNHSMCGNAALLVAQCFIRVYVCVFPPKDDHQPGHLPAAVRSLSALQRHAHQKGFCGDPDPQNNIW